MNKLFLIPVIIFMTMLGALGGFFFKKSTGGDSLFSSLLNRNLYIGGLIYVVSALLNVWVLKFMPYSVVMPMCAITYIWTMVLSCVILKEKITKFKIMGVIFIIAGATVVGL